MVDTFDVAATSRGAGTCREFVYIENFVNGCRRLGADLESVVGQESRWAFPEGNKADHHFFAVPSAVNSSALTANMSARRLKRFVKKM